MIRYVIPLPLLMFGMVYLLPAQPPTPVEVKGHADLIHSIILSPDGKFVATAGFDKAVKLWEYSNGVLKEGKSLPGHTDPVYCVAFSPDNKTLASSGQDKSIRIWNVAEAKMTSELKGHTDIVDTIAFSPDGKTLASGSGMADKSVRLWDLKDGKDKSLGTHNGSVYSVVFSPNGKTLASSGSDNMIKIWDVASQKEITQLKGHEMGVTGLAFAGDNATLVSISQDRTIRVWNLSIAAPKEVKKDPPKEEPKKEPKKDEKKDVKKDEKKDPPKDMKKDPDPKDLLPVKDPREVKKFGPTPDDLYGIAWSKDAKMIVTAGYSGVISVWDLTDPKPKFSKKQKSLAYCVTATPDGKTALSGHLNGTIIVTPLTPGK